MYIWVDRRAFDGVGVRCKVCIHSVVRRHMNIFSRFKYLSNRQVPMSSSFVLWVSFILGSGFKKHALDARILHPAVQAMYRFCLSTSHHWLSYAVPSTH